jgi:hypothetical protein
MPLKNGELSTPELRKLIKQHNKLMSIEIPKGSKRQDIINLINNNGYNIDHAKQRLVPRVQMKRKPIVKLPPPETEEEKRTKQEKRQEAKTKREEKIKAIKTEGIKQAGAISQIKIKKLEKEKKKLETLLKDSKVSKSEFKADQKLVNDAFDYLSSLPVVKARPIPIATKATIKKNPFDDIAKSKSNLPAGVSNPFASGQNPFIKKEEPKKTNSQLWKEYFKILSDNKTLLENTDKRKPNQKPRPMFKNSYDFFKNNGDALSSGTSQNAQSYLNLLNKKLNEIKKNK